jgi:cytochrome b subunit of formate dehydrogenase
MAKRFGFTRVRIGSTYDTSIHGQRIAAGHQDAATCNDCHGSHRILPSRDGGSMVNREHIPETCGQCHFTILGQYNQSIHGQNFAAGSPNAPVCNSCHRDHRVLPISSDLFKLSVIEECGHCHQDLLKSYRMSYHGKVTQLGGTTTARCYSCHGHHDILPVNDPKSRVARGNLVHTCAQCHSGSNEKFTKYFPHGNYLDRKRYPIIFYPWLIMTTLLVSTLTFFTIHTILWFLRLFIPRVLAWRKAGAHGAIAMHGGTQRYVQRFSLYNRLTHAVVATSFLGLTLTGLPLKYSYMGWAHKVFDFLGGFEVAGFLHRMFAAMTLVYVIMHAIHLARLYRKRRDEGRGIPKLNEILGPHSMVLNLADIKQFLAHIRYFLFLGPKPKFDRWTYYEKFDYWGELWGVVIIGSTGFMLWFPLLVAKFLPGWIFNVATVIHSIEALLAAAVIFTVHFFNAHFRPDKFPMDNVIFTGTVPEPEFAEERPLEYARLKNEGKFEELITDPPSRRQLLWARILGLSALALGVGLIVCVIFAEIHQHFLMR